MRKSIIKSIAISVILIIAAYAGEEQGTGGVRDYFPQGTSLKKSAAVTATFNYSARARLINGPARNRVNIGYAGDGYAVADTVRFPAQADSNIAYRRGLSSITNNKMVMRPCPRYDKFFNWYIVNVLSQQSGVSVAPAYGQPKTTVVNNALGGTHDLDRLGWCDDNLALDLFSQAQQQLGTTIHWHVVVLNINGYYNSGGPVVVFAYPNWGDIACHEEGHGFHVLTDEYFGSGTDNTEYTEINSTHNRDGTKWGQWIGYRDVDTRTRSGGGTPTGDTVGYYLGSRYVSSGQYRPTSNSKMNMTSQGNPVSYNAPSREKIIHDIYALVRPVDTLFDTVGQKTDPDSLWVRVIDPAVLKVDWYVGTTLKKANGGTSIKKSEIATVPGTYTVRAHVYDEVLRHANSNNASPDTLDLVRKDTTRMYQDVQWNVRIVTVAVSFNEIQKEVFRADVYKNVIVYGLEHPGAVAIDVYRIDGSLFKKMRVYGNAGRNTVTFSAMPAGIPAGMYVVLLKCADGAQVMKMNLTK